MQRSDVHPSIILIIQGGTGDICVTIETQEYL
jgi:hypothetical protein